MVIFGNPRSISEFFGRYLNETLRVCRELGIQEIFTIGGPAGMAPANLPVPVIECGFLDASKVAEIINTSRVGMVRHFPGDVGKSGVFAAIAAHGALPVLPRFGPSNGAGQSGQKNYLFMDQIDAQTSGDALQQVADRAWKWYQAHNLSRTADAYAELLKNCALPEAALETSWII
jgi:hypothetical protein